MRSHVLLIAIVLLLIATLTTIQNPLHLSKAMKEVVTTTVPIANIVPIPPNATVPPMTHYSFNVKARDFTTHSVYCCKGCELFIDFYVIRYTWWGSEWSDIIFRVVAPDGREVVSRQKVYTNKYVRLVADLEGAYVLEFDNTYSGSDKYIDLAIAIVTPPQTVTVTSTVYWYKTITTTFERTIPTPTTIYVITTTTLPITTTETVERTATLTVTEKVLDTTILATIAALLLALGIIIGYFIKKIK
jgi:hypothetical protein